MKFSIVIPVFGTEAFLPRCLDSFAAQTDGDFEAIVVDDCSPGTGRSVIAPYQAAVGADHRAARCEAELIVSKYDARFKYVRHEKNLSLFQARQTGLRMAEGEFVIPFDSDDYALPELLARLRAEIEEKEKVKGEGEQRNVSNSTVQPSTSNLQPDVIVYQMMYDDGRKVTKPSVRYRNEQLTGAEALDRFFASKIQCGICGKAVRREIYLRAMDQLAAPRDFYLNSSEDLCQTFPVLVNARAVSTLSYPGYRYWSNGDSLTTTLADPAKLGKAAENTCRVFDTLADFVRRNGHDSALLSRLEKFQRPTLRWYLGCIRRLPEAEWRACVSELCRRFAPALVAREAMLLIEESVTYRLGRTVLGPFKRLLGRG